MTMHSVVVANEARARILGGDSLLEELVEIADLVHPEARREVRKRPSDCPGRFSRGAAGRTAADPDTDPEEVESPRFARRVCDELRKGRNEGRFERLILAAPPRFRGCLRAALDDGVARCVVAEIGNDCTREPLPGLPEVLRRTLSASAGLP